MPDVSVLSIRYLQIGTKQMESAHIYTQLATLEVTAIFESLDDCEKLDSWDIRTRCGDLALLLIGLYAKLYGKETGKKAALMAIQGAMKICEKLAVSYPFHPLKPTLVRSIQNLPFRLSDAEMHDEAIIAGQHVVDIHGKLDKDHPGSSGGLALAEALYSLSSWLHDVGETEEALNVVKEIIELSEIFTQEQSTTSASNINPTSFVNTIITYLEGIREKPCEVIFVQHSVNILRMVAKESSSTYKPALAQSLHILSIHLEKIGHKDDAIGRNREAADICRDLPGESVNAFRMEHVAALRGITIKLIEAGRKKEAIATHELFVNILRHANPFGPDLSESLPMLAEHFSAIGWQDKALLVITEVVQIRREWKRREEHNSSYALAQALYDFFRHLTVAGRWFEALEAIREAVDLDPSSYKSSLRESLYNVFKDYKYSRDRWEGAFDLVRTGKNTEIYRLELDHALGDAYNHYRAEGQWDRALEIKREAASTYPIKYGWQLDQALRDAIKYYEAKGKWSQALDILRETESSYPREYSTELDQALYYAFEHYRIKGQWCEAHEVMREASQRHPTFQFPIRSVELQWHQAVDELRKAIYRNPDQFGSQLGQAAHGAFIYYRSKGLRNEALNVMRVAASRNPDEFGAELDQAFHEAFNYYKTRELWDGTLNTVREAAGIDLDVFDPVLGEALLDYYSKKYEY